VREYTTPQPRQPPTAFNARLSMKVRRFHERKGVSFVKPGLA
jgi:hypothetical protein